MSRVSNRSKIELIFILAWIGLARPWQVANLLVKLRISLFSNVFASFCYLCAFARNSLGPGENSLAKPGFGLMLRPNNAIIAENN